MTRRDKVKRRTRASPTRKAVTESEPKTAEAVSYTHGKAICKPVLTPVNGAQSRVTDGISGRQALSYVLALAGYTALVVIFSWSLLRNLSSTIAGPSGGDNFFSAWTLWEYCHNISVGQDPAFSHYIFAQAPNSMVFVDGAIDMLPSCAMQWFMTPLMAYNIIVLLSFILGGFCMFVLARFYTVSSVASFAVGVFFTFSTYHFSHALGHLGLLTVESLPFFAWTMVRFYYRPSWTTAAVFGLGIASVPLSEAYFIAYFLFPALAAGFLTIIFTNRRWLRNTSHLWQSVFAGLLGACISLPFLASSLFDLRPEVEYALKLQTGIIGQTSADPLSYILPVPGDLFFGHLTSSLYSAMTSAPFGVEQDEFLGYPLLILALAAFLIVGRRGAITFWWVLAVAGIVLSFGPTLTILGHTVTSVTPYRFLFVGPLANFRAPGRLAIVPLTALSVVAAMSLGSMLEATRGTRPQSILVTLSVALMLGALAGSTLSPSPIFASDAGVPGIYSLIARDHSGSMVLDLPMSGTLAETYLFYQTVHHHPDVFGYGPRVTNTELWSLEGVPYLTQFSYYTTPNVKQLVRTQGDIFPVPSFRDVMAEYHIGYIVLHYRPEDTTYPALDHALHSYLGKPFYIDVLEGITAWHITRPSRSARLRTQMRLESGWVMAPQVLNGQLQHVALGNGRIAVRAPSSEMRFLTFLATPYIGPNAIDVAVNGKSVLRSSLDQPWVTRSIRTARFPLREGMNTIILKAVDGCRRLPGGDPGCYSFAIQRLRLHP